MGDTYQIRLFTFDGKVSHLSEPLTNTGYNSVAETADDAPFVIKDGTLYVNGDNATVEIYDAAGIRLYAGAADTLSLDRFGKGLRVIVVRADGKTTARKTLL